MQIDGILERLAGVVSESTAVDSLVPQLLELLISVTGMDSVYLTRVDSDREVQVVLHARNEGPLNVPEGLQVSVCDTLCKRALEEGETFVEDVTEQWGDSSAARELGIHAYACMPVSVGGELYGTLCGASASRMVMGPEAQRVLKMFAHLVARQIEHDRLLARTRDERREYLEYALLDPLTALPNRRALIHELTRALANADRTGMRVHVALVDLDGFKAVNDRYGHDVGDRLLIEMGRKMAAGMRHGDFVARFGGDEFVVFGLAGDGCPQAGREALRKRIEGLIRGRFQAGEVSVDFAGGSVGVATSGPECSDCDALLVQADREMYRAKRGHDQRDAVPAPHPGEGEVREAPSAGV